MELLKNILLVSYIKNKGIRRLCFVIGIIPTLILFLATIGTSDFFSFILNKFVQLLILFYLPFLIAVTIKWIKVGFSEKEDSKVKQNKKAMTEKVNSTKENKQNKVSDKKEDGFSIKELFWHSQKEIIERANNYDNVKWYKSARFVPCFIYFVLVLFGLYYNQEREIMIWVGNAIIFIPAIYFSVKGYRWVILALLGLFIFDFLQSAILFPKEWENGVTVYFRVIIWIAIAGEMLTAFRIENYRVKNKLSPKKRILRDVLVGIVFPFIIACAISTIRAARQYMNTTSETSYSEIDDKSYKAIGKIYMHTTGITDYCNNAGYSMVRYPELFKQTFANKISFAEQEMKRLNVNSPSIYQIDELKTVSYTAWNEQRQMVIANIIMDEQHIQPDEFQWNDTYYQVLTQAEFCELMDKKAEVAIDSNKDFDILRN